MNKTLIGVVLIVLGFSLSGCSNQQETIDQTGTRDQYLEDLYQVDPTHFKTADAALSYLKQFCEIRLSGGISNMDSIELVADKYCDTDLAKELGVRVAPAQPVGFDEKAFVAKAKKIDPELFRVLEDGSFIEPVALANNICSQTASELQTMRSNAAGYWESSFNKFAMETICPEKIPE
jgi:uncharacterized lipoprotein NlpE involved in copper resistance